MKILYRLFKFILILIMLVITNMAFTQQRTVTGTVISNEDKAALPEVTIIVKGTTKGTKTDVDGKYSLDLSGNETLVFSYVGFISKEVPVSNRSVIDISLAPDNQHLEDVVVVGYGSVKKVILPAQYPL